MRTTLRINDQILADAKKLAIDTDRTLTQVVEDALRITLAHRRQNGKQKRFKLHTFGGGKLNPGIDLSNNAALADLLDEDDELFGR
jgi:hypothetical protein